MRSKFSKLARYISVILIISLVSSTFSITVSASSKLLRLGESESALGASLPMAGTYSDLPAKTVAEFNFENDIVGKFPSGWTANNEKNVEDLNVQNDPKNSSNKVLRVTSEKRSTNKLGFVFPEKEQNYAKITFDMYVSSSKANQGWSRVQLASSEDAQFEGHEAARVGISSFIHHYPVFGGGEVQIPNTQRDKWIKYELSVDVPKQQYALFVDGVEVITNGDFTKFNKTGTKATFVDRFHILSGGTGKSDYFLDNIKIEMSDIEYIDKVTGFKPLTQLEVPIGTEFSDLSLPTEILAYTVNHPSPTGIAYPVVWDSVGFNSENLGNQTIKGLIAIPNDVEHSGNTIEINVLVTQPEYYPVKITQGKYRYLFATEDEAGVFWESQNPSIATVDDKGLVSAVLVGKALVIGTAPDSTKYKYEITVVADTEEARFKELKQNWMSAHSVNPNIDYTAPEFTEMVTKINVTAKELWETMDISLGSNKQMWETGQATDALTMKAHFNNYRAMMKAYYYPGGELYGNKELFKDTIAAIDIAMNTGIRGLKFGNQNAVGNWYEWQISTPFALNEISMLTSDYLPSSTIEAYCKASMRYPNIESWNGANVAETAFAVLAPAIIMNDVAQLDRIKKQMPRSGSVVTSGNGIYSDGSYMFHTYSPYNLGYGMAFMDGSLSVLSVVAGTDWAVDSLNSIITDYVRDGLVPVVHKGSGMGMFNGRGITREPNLNPASSELGSGNAVISNIMKSIPLAPPEEQAYFKQAVKYWVSSTWDDYNWNSILNPNYKMKVLEILDDPTIPSTRPYNGAKVYGYIDRMVQFGDTYTAGVSMYSTRTWNYNATGNENKMGWHTGDGMLYVYNDDVYQYGEGILPTIDLKRLPGITVEQNLLTDFENKEKRSTEKWAGSSTLGNISTTGMVLNTSNLSKSNLYAKKSYFFSEDKIIALGSDIKSDSGNQIETIIENRMIKDDKSNVITVNGAVDSGVGTDHNLPIGSWIHQQGNRQGADIGYLILEDSSVHTEKVTDTGSFFPKLTTQQIAGPGTTIHTKSYFQSYIKHGTSPTDESYAYAILPGKSAAETASYAGSSNISILAQSSDIHAIRDGKKVMMNVWNQNGGSAGGITVNKGASITAEYRDNLLYIAVSQPEQSNQVVDISFDDKIVRIASVDSNIATRTENGKTIFAVNTNGKAGHSSVIVLEVERNDNTFESLAIGEAPANWNITGGTAKVVKENATNKALELSATNNVVVTTNLRAADEGTQVTLRLQMNPNSSGKIIFGTSNMDSIVAEVVGGKIRAGDKETAFNADTWYNLKLTADEINRKATLSVNDIVLASDISYSGGMELLKINLAKGSNALIDDLKAEEISFSGLTAPKGLTFADFGARYVNLKWNAATGNTGAIKYNLYQNGTKITTVEATSHSITNLLPETDYEFKVEAIDSSGKISPLSDPLTIKTIAESTNVVIDFENETLGTTPLGWVRTGTDTSAKLEVSVNPEKDSTNSSDKALDIFSSTSGKATFANYTFEPIAGTSTVELKMAILEKQKYISFNFGDKEHNSAGDSSAVWIMTDELTVGSNTLTYHKKGASANAGRLKLSDYDVSKWYSFKIELDVPNQKYSLWLDDIKLLTDEPFFKAVDEISRFTVATPNSGTGGMFVDDILLPSGIVVSDAVTSISTPTDISAAYNTGFYALGLPETVTAITTNYPAGKEFKVNWNYSDYDPKQAGEQIINGKIATSADISVSDPSVKIKVIVAAPASYSISLDSNVQNGTLISSHSAAIEGTAVVITAKPNAGYRLKALMINGESVTVNSKYEHKLILNKTITVSAQFEPTSVVPKIYTVLVDTVITNGTITTSHLSAEENTEVTITIVPNAGYMLKELKINEIPTYVDNQSTYKFLLLSDVFVSAEFELIPPKTYEIAIEDTLGGKITSSHLSAPEGTMVTLMIIPKTGYRLKALLINGAPIEIGQSLTYSLSLTENLVVAAEFESIGGSIIFEPSEPSTSTSSGGRDSVDSKTKSSNSSQSTVLSANETQAAINRAIKESVSLAAVDIKFKNITAMSPSIIEQIQNSVPNGKEVRVLVDSVVDNKLVGRLYLPINNLPKSATIKTEIRTNSAVTKSTEKKFVQFFSNDLDIFELTQLGEFGTEIKVAVKTDIKNPVKENISIYSYSAKNNTYTLMKDAKPFVDINGFVHFSVSSGGTIIVSDGLLVKK